MDIEGPRIQAMKAKGFSLLECLIGLSLSFFIVLACLEFFGAARKSYSRLKDKEEAAQSALAALDKMKVDILRAGEGLVLPVSLGLVEPVAEAGGGLLITRSERSYELAGDLAAGAVRIPLTSTADLKPGREICLADDAHAEVLTVSSVGAGTAAVSPAVGRAYAREKARALLLEKISLTMDARLGVLRRRVNLSPAQPLLENARDAEFAVDRPANLVRVRFRLNSQGDPIYELRLFPKNPALAGRG
jgi:type II secretory pathway pseudopilin PulG